MPTKWTFEQESSQDSRTEIIAIRSSVHKSCLNLTIYIALKLKKKSLFGMPLMDPRTLSVSAASRTSRSRLLMIAFTFIKILKPIKIRMYQSIRKIKNINNFLKRSEKWLMMIKMMMTIKSMSNYSEIKIFELRLEIRQNCRLNKN